MPAYFPLSFILAALHTLLYVFHEKPLVILPQRPWALLETHRLSLDASPSWDVYVDGSWSPKPGAGESLLGESGTYTGGSALLLVHSGTALHTDVIVIRKDLFGLLPVNGEEGLIRLWNCWESTLASLFSTVWGSAAASTQIIKP